MVSSVFASFFTTDKGEIEKRLASLVENISRDRGEGKISLGLKNQKLQKMLTDPCRISIPRHNIEVKKSPLELASYVSRLGARAQRVNIRFYDTSISLINNTEAVVNTTLRAKGEIRSNKSFSEVEQIKIELVKKDNEWLFSSFEQVEVLQK